MVVVCGVAENAGMSGNHNKPIKYIYMRARAERRTRMVRMYPSSEGSSNRSASGPYMRRTVRTAGIEVVQCASTQVKVQYPERTVGGAKVHGKKRCAAWCGRWFACADSI